MSLDASFDIKNIICIFLYDLNDTINLYNLNKDHQINIRIINLYDIPTKYIKRLNQQIIEQNKYRYVEKINACNNNQIKNVNHMKKTLKKLHCNYISGINQDGISELNLIELNAWNNEKIKNVNHMKNALKKLDCGRECGIDQNGISELNLIQLNAKNNKKITNVNHMKNTIKILDCGLNSGIDQKGISQLNLIKLNADKNKKIENVNHMKNTRVAART